MRHELRHGQEEVSEGRRCEALGPQRGTRHRMDVQTIDTTQRRLKILTTDEIDALYGRPIFTPDERLYYFAISPPEQEALQEFRTVKAQALFILQLGYFKAQHVFVPCDLVEMHEDLAYILASYFPATPLEDRRPLNKRTRLKQHHLILALCNYRSCDAYARQQLAAKARHAATVSAKPVYIFQELLHDLDEHRIVAPGYSFLQELVSTALTEEHHRVTTIVRHALTPADTAALEHLLEEGPGLYALTQLKREPKDFSAGAMKHERQRGGQLQGLYRVAQQVLPQLTISPESIKYYASLVIDIIANNFLRLPAVNSKIVNPQAISITRSSYFSFVLRKISLTMRHRLIPEMICSITILILEMRRLCSFCSGVSSFPLGFF